MNVTVDLPEQVAADLKKLALVEDRTVEQQARGILRRYFAENPPPSAYGVVLVSCNDKLIQTIKEIRVLTDLGLKAAKDLADRAVNGPVEIIRYENESEAQRAVALLTSAGATAQVEKR